MNEINEAKVKEAIIRLDNLTPPGAILSLDIASVGRVLTDVRMAAKTLKEAIAPEQPEIPEGCPVLVWCEGYEKKPHFYVKYDKTNPDYPHVVTGGANFHFAEIDYQRKGHVIPWHGGDMNLHGFSVKKVDITVFMRNGWCGRLKDATSFAWEWNRFSDSEENYYDIIAYVIWPEWVKS